MYRINMAIAGIMFLAAGCTLSAEEDLAANEAEGTQRSLATTEDIESLSPLAVEEEDMSLVTEDVQATDEESADLIASDVENRHGYWKCKAWDKHCDGHHCSYYYSEHKKKDKARDKAKKKCERNHDKCKVDCKWYD